ncbi:FUSC family protein [Paenibacillus antarcticus]|uniref:Aromatic acid exporter family protein n=1 Tax=Paenibacillus antarcticus TaxID=253703 RepID=A0A168QKW2_9BACL|nr:aromatic acid exporter family protein [Paenibacillus antarcticus]OAB47899.1 hypothetical protein PBAT_03220 [Paenibacillus antarcticus]
MQQTIGMRNIKTAIAILVCLIIANLLQLQYPFYAAIATVISMENSVTNSFAAGKNRVMGTFVGAGAGLFFATIQPENIWLCAIGSIVAIYICNLLKWNKSIPIAIIVFLAIMLNLQGDSPLHYSINRIIDTLIGVGVAVMVNYLVFPPKYEINIRRARRLLSKEMVYILDQLMAKKEFNLKKLRAQLKKLEMYLDISKEEFHLIKDGVDSLEHIINEFESYKLIYEHLKMIQKLDGEQILSVDNMLRLGIYQCDVSGDEEELQRDSQFIIYNYHIDRVLNELESMGLPLPYGAKMEMLE